MSTNLESQVPPQVMLTQFITGAWVSQAIYVAAELGVADILQAGPKNYEDIAKETSSHPKSVYRVLRALASIGIFNETEYGFFSNTPLSDCLLSETPGSLRAFSRLFGQEWARKPWSEILYSVNNGKPAFDYVYNMNKFDFHSHNTESNKLFGEAMKSFSELNDGPISIGYNFSDFEKVVDIGGGYGSLLGAILNNHPKVKGVLFDLPVVIDDALNSSTLGQIKDRLELSAGDFFESVPEGDILILKHVLHDWDNESAITILKNCRKSVAENGKLLILEHLIEPGNTPCPGKFLDLEMLVITTGQERTQIEYEALLNAAGFKLNRIIPTMSAITIIEGIPV